MRASAHRTVWKIGLTLAATAALSVPVAGADGIDETFNTVLRNTGVDPGAILGNSGDTEALGHSVCEQLSTPASDAAAVAAEAVGTVKKDAGVSPELAKIVTEVAVSSYCPQMASKLASGELPEIRGGLPVLQVPGIPLLPGQ